MPQDIRILPAAEADLPAISTLAGIIWRAHYPGIITHEQIDYMLAWMYDPQVMARELRAGVRYEKLLVDGTLSGFAAWAPATAAGECKLHKLYVLPALHGQGIGSQLLGHVLVAARKAGFHAISLQVNKRNEKAIAAYTRNGFVIQESIRDDIGRGFVMDDFVMARPLYRGTADARR